MDIVVNLGLGIIDGLLSHWIISLFTGGSAVSFALLRRYRPSWAPVAGYGGLAAVAALVMTATLSQIATLDQLRREVSAINAKIPEPSGLTVETIEQEIREWSDSLGFSTQSRVPQDAVFSIDVVMQGKASCRIAGKDDMLTFHCDLLLSDRIKQSLAKLTPQDRDKLRYEVAISLVHLGVSYRGLADPISAIHLEKVVPIDDSLNQATFRDILSHLTLAQVVVKSTLESGAEGSKQSKP